MSKYKESPARKRFTWNLRRQFQDMYSEDRRDAEIARAEAGLPPLDDLSGMYSEDIRDVMKARVKHGTG
jgi:hypothetical protein